MRPADYLRLTLLAAIWGASFLFMRVASPQFGAVNTAFLRVFFGCAGLLVILLVMRRTFRFDGKLKPALLLGVINSGIPFLCTVWPHSGCRPVTPPFSTPPHR